MPTTRSASKKEKSLKEHGSSKDASPGSTTTKSHGIGSALKRKRAGDNPAFPPKKSKTGPNATKPTQRSQLTDSYTDQSPVYINRSPVLQLWGATVASFLYPDEDWTTYLGIGSSISRLCAISKGRAIGKVEPKNPSTESQEQDKKQNRRTSDETRNLEVMGFPMQIKAGEVVVDGKKKPAKEHLLQAKFGGERPYTKVKEVMKQALQTWKDDKEQLDKKAFHMYEKFRPSIATGSSGWGRKGPLDLEQMKITIESAN